MIFQDYNLDDSTPIPLADTLRLNALRVAERKTHRRPASYRMSVGAPGERAYRIMHDRLGDVYRVYRGLYVHRSGRGYTARSAGL